MKTNYYSRTFSLVGLFLAASVPAGGQSLNISWHTIDGGGGRSTGSNFELVGTIGQHDAGPGSAGMTGGSFNLVGGFWTIPSSCTCPGDMNGDGAKDGRDLQQFVNCFVAGGSCGCADIDGVPGVSMGDISAFASDLLAGSACP